jgi:hypothetical protein
LIEQGGDMMAHKKKAKRQPREQQFSATGSSMGNFGY